MNILQSIVSYDDLNISTLNNNPSQQSANWSRNYFGITCQNPTSQKFTIPANSSLTLFDGTRSLGLSNTSTVSITNTTGSTYRISDSTGASAAYRTGRVISADATTQFTVISNNNAIVSLTNSGGTAPSFGTVNVGDIVYIGPNSNFNVMNQGYFPIVAIGSNYIQIQNPLAVAETQVLGSNYATNFLIYSSNGVQIGDTLNLNAGFSPVSFGSYLVSNVTNSFVEFTSTSPLPLQSSVTPTSSGIVIYSNAIYVIYAEVNQNCVFRMNADSSNNNLVQPFTLDNPGQPETGMKGLFTKVGSTYRCVVVNQSLLNPCELYAFTAQGS